MQRHLQSNSEYKNDMGNLSIRAQLITSVLMTALSLYAQPLNHRRYLEGCTLSVAQKQKDREVGQCP